MKRYLVAFLLLCLMVLTGCQAREAGVSFNEEHNRLRYAGESYAVTRQTVNEEELTGNEVRFLELYRKGDEALALTNLYQTTKGLAIGVNDHYYQVKKEKEASESELLVLDDLFVARPIFQLSEHHSRLLETGQQTYWISDIVVAEEELTNLVTTVAESRVFETETGKPLSTEALREIAMDGGDVPDRSQWFYGDIYQTKDGHFAIEINDQYRQLEEKKVS